MPKSSHLYATGMINSLCGVCPLQYLSQSDYVHAQELAGHAGFVNEVAWHHVQMVGVEHLEEPFGRDCQADKGYRPMRHYAVYLRCGPGFDRSPEHQNLIIISCSLQSSQRHRSRAEFELNVGATSRVFWDGTQQPGTGYITGRIG